MGLYRESEIRRELMGKCDQRPVIFTARVGSDAFYTLTGMTVLDADAK